MSGWWVTDILREDGAMVLIAWVYWVIFSICLHELGHGWAAIRYGDRTPIETRHMTWNPLVHMGQMSLLMFAIVGFAWGAMPVNPARMRGRHAEAAVAAAGPAVNVGLFVVCVIATALALEYGAKTNLRMMFLLESPPDPFWQNVFWFFLYGAILNIALLLLNLIPVMPLDGGRIAAHFIPAYRRLWQRPDAGMMAMVGMIVVLVLASRFLVGFAAGSTIRAIDLVQGLLP